MEIMKKSLSNQIYDVLKINILNQNIPFGSKLVNRTLQQEFDVSSSPVRDAINRLYQDGLVSTITKSGATVVEFDLNFYIEVNEILLFITSASVHLAGQKANPKDIVPLLEEIIAFQEKNLYTDAYYDYDYKFHKTFIDYSENARLKHLFKQYNVLHEVLVRHLYSPNSKRTRVQSLAMHKEITLAFGEKNYEKARQRMEEHYAIAGNIFKDIFIQSQKEENIDEESLKNK